nr:ribonuclease H-like domain-containing protein [Tanacetum cinerariifolium]
MRHYGASVIDGHNTSLLLELVVSFELTGIIYAALGLKIYRLGMFPIPNLRWSGIKNIKRAYVTSPAGPQGLTLHLYDYIVGPTGSIRAHYYDTLSSGTYGFPGQATSLPYAFTARCIHDPTTGAWNMDTYASSHLNASVTSLNDVFNTCIYSSVADFMTRRVLLRRDSTGDLYPATPPSPIPHAFLENVDYQSGERLCNLRFFEYLKLYFFEYEHVAVNSTRHGLDTATIRKPASLVVISTDMDESVFVTSSNKVVITTIPR